MKAVIVPALLIGAFAWALAANAQSATPVPAAGTPAATLSPTAAPFAPATPAVPGVTSEPSPGGAPPSPTMPSPGPNTTAPVPDVPAPSATSTSRAHLHRPGTDVDGDVLTGSLASEVYVLKGNVMLHSDPKIDREIGSASENDDPVTVTADEIDVDKLGMTYVAKGNVHFVQGNRSGRSDLAMLDERRHTLDLVGNASVVDGEHRAKAAKMHYDMYDKQFLGSGDVRIYEAVPTPDPNAPTPPPKRKRRLPL